MTQLFFLGFSVYLDVMKYDEADVLVFQEKFIEGVFMMKPPDNEGLTKWEMVADSRKSESEDESKDIEILATNSNINPSLDDDDGDDVFSTNINACVRCGADLGDMNRRQLK